jgi:hypothetical protein
MAWRVMIEKHSNRLSQEQLVGGSAGSRDSAYATVARFCGT